MLLDSARTAIREYRIRRDSVDPAVVNFPSSALVELHRCAALGAHERVRQVIPFDPHMWNPDAFEHTIWREAAEDGLAVARLYVLPHRGISREMVSRQLEQDAAQGVVSRILFLGNIPESDRAEIPNGMWLLDEDIVVLSRSGGAREDSIWTISERAADRGQSEALWDQLWSWSDTQDEPSAAPVELEEPLALSADLINGVAGVLCTSNHVDRHGCDWYHGAWQYLRLLNLVSTPTWHSEFYLEWLGTAAAKVQSPRALITGTADYSMLAYVCAAADVSGIKIDVLDMCATPLFACRWFAKQLGLRIGTIEDDLFEISAPIGIYDLICCDAFLTRFGPTELGRVTKAWGRLLRPGGMLVTTVRIHPRFVSARDPETAARDFRERAEQRAHRWRPFLNRSPVEIGELAEVYARRMKSNDLGSELAIREVLKQAGFEVLFEELASVPGELYPTTYLRLACEKTQITNQGEV
jgi:SAM-dependent methyltransferase